MIELVPPAAWQSGRWANGGGTTHTIARWLDGDAVLARLSVAAIERAGPFSTFAGQRRWLAVLDDGGGLVLARGGVPVALAAGEALAFGGDEAIAARPRGPARVCNLIARADVAWSARVVAAGERVEARPGVTAVFAVAAQEVGLGGRIVELATHVTAIARDAGPVRAGGPALVLQLALPDGVAAVTVGDTRGGSP